MFALNSLLSLMSSVCQVAELRHLMRQRDLLCSRDEVNVKPGEVTGGAG